MSKLNVSPPLLSARASLPTLSELGLSIPFSPTSLFSDLSARGCPISAISGPQCKKRCGLICGGLQRPGRPRQGKPEPGCALEAKAACPGTVPANADTQPGPEAPLSCWIGARGRPGPVLAQTPVGSWEEAALRATHSDCLFLTHTSSARSSSTAAVAIPTTETAATMMFFWRNCRSCEHGMPLLGTSK